MVDVSRWQRGEAERQVSRAFLLVLSDACRVNIAMGPSLQSFGKTRACAHGPGTQGPEEGCFSWADAVSGEKQGPLLGSGTKGRGPCTHS